MSDVQRRRNMAVRGWHIDHYPCYIHQRKRLHGTSHVLLSCIVAGTAVHHLGDRSVIEGGASVSIVHYEQRHDIVTTAAGIEVYNVFLDPQHHPLPQLPAPVDAALAQIVPLHPAFRNDSNTLVRLEFDDFSQVREILARLYAEDRQQAPGWQRSTANLLENFLIELARRHLAISAQPPGRQRQHAVMEELRQHLDQVYDRPVRLVELSRDFGYERNYLCRAFKAYTGKSIGNYLDDRRVQASMRALQRAGPRIVDIAMTAGFQDLSRFNKVFKKRVGMTPSAYRKLWIEGDSTTRA